MDPPPGTTGLIAVRGRWARLAEPRQVCSSLDDLAAAADELGWRADDPRPDGPVLAGWLTDDLSAALLGLPDPPDRPAPAPLPPVHFGWHDHVEWHPAPPAWTPTPIRPAGVVTPTLHRTAHAAAVEEIRGWIAAGDVYQVNLTTQVGVPWAGTGHELAQRLWRAARDASHAAWLHAPGGVEIVSCSPETFLHADGPWLQVKPIKGTRPRAADAAADAALRAELEHSAKDRAEHVMIVDLERNDLGRVCDTGTVRVPDLLSASSRAGVWHLVSTVVGRARDDVTLGDVLRALFPCGSVTGAPKRMAVARTPSLEPTRRGVYCGAVGVVGRGFVDLSVAIRTAVLFEGWASYGTGGGIVADSTAEDEWRELAVKAAPFLAATDACWPD